MRPSLRPQRTDKGVTSDGGSNGVGWPAKAPAEQKFAGAAVAINFGATKRSIAVARFEDGDLARECRFIGEPEQRRARSPGLQ